MLETSYGLKLSKNITFLYRKSLKLNNQQEIRCFSNNASSSETTRETSFDFKSFCLPQHVKNIDESFLEWFIGFVEGSGTFIVSKNRLFFIINQKDVKTLYRIRAMLGFGKVSWYKTYGRFIVTGIKNITRLIHLFNGNLLLSKVNLRFDKFIETYNTNNSKKILPLPHLSKIKKIITNTSWLTGFVSAEGCFNAHIILEKEYSFQARFFLNQKNEFEILNLICESLNIGRVILTTDSENQRLVITKYSDLSILMAYFKKHPFFHVTKRLSYLRFKRYLNFLNKNNFSKEDLLISQSKILRLARLINIFQKDEDIVQKP